MEDTTPQARYTAILDRMGHGAVAEFARASGMSRRSIEFKQRGERRVIEYDVMAVERFEQLRASQGGMSYTAPCPRPSTRP